jgi:MFS family permease
VGREDVIFRALKHRNFRLFFYGQLASMIGTWMQIVALSWLVYRMTNSAFLLGCAGFALNFPAIVVSPFAGIASDRFDRRKLLILIQSFSMLQAVIMTVLVFTARIELWHIFLLSVLLGVCNAAELTVRQSFINEMIDDKKDLGNAIALNSSIFNASRLIGPAAAGVVIAAFGEGMCFLLNALSFVPVIVALFMMDMPLALKRAAANAGHELKEGFRYAFGFMPIRSILLLLSVLSMLTGVFQTLLPVFAKEIFGGGPKTLGFLLSFSGVGALAGAFWLAGRVTVVGLGRHVAIASAAAGAGMMVFAMTTDVHAAALMCMLGGLGMILAIGGSNIIIQSLVDEDKRGRVMSLYGLALIGMSPGGNIVAGVAAAHIGIVSTMIFAGVFTLVCAFIFWFSLPHFRSLVRPVYVKKGLVT